MECLVRETCDERKEGMKKTDTDVKIKKCDSIRKIQYLSELAKSALDKAGVKTAAQLQELTYNEIEKLDCPSVDKTMIDYATAMLLEEWEPEAIHFDFGMGVGSRKEVCKILYSLAELKEESLGRINDKNLDLGCWATVDELIVALVDAIKVA